MSAAPTQAATDVVNIEIDGVAMTAPKGSMIIHASDKAGIPIPRFCYHEKLPIAANCRMCLVEVEKAPKPLPVKQAPGPDVYFRKGFGLKTEVQAELARLDRHGRRTLEHDRRLVEVDVSRADRHRDAADPVPGL